jgi:hypothetical protein
VDQECVIGDDLFVSALLSSQLESSIALTRHDEIWQDFAFPATRFVRGLESAFTIAPNEGVCNLVQGLQAVFGSLALRAQGSFMGRRGYCNTGSMAFFSARKGVGV